MSVCAFKYIHKYVYKGHDRATIEVGEQNDEIKQHLDAQYISASEAVWHLFCFSMHEEEPNIVCLQVHLPGEQAVIFNDGDNPLEVVEHAAHPKSTLTAF